jgi:hypothetical protein
VHGSPEQIHLTTWVMGTTFLQALEAARQIPVDGEGGAGTAGPQASPT